MFFPKHGHNEVFKTMEMPLRVCSCFKLVPVPQLVPHSEDGQLVPLILGVPPVAIDTIRDETPHNSHAEVLRNSEVQSMKNVDGHNLHRHSDGAVE